VRNVPTKKPVTMYETVSVTELVDSVLSVSSSLSSSRCGRGDSKLIRRFGGIIRPGESTGKWSSGGGLGETGDESEDDDDLDKEAGEGNSSKNVGGDGGKGIVAGSTAAGLGGIIIGSKNLDSGSEKETVLEASPRERMGMTLGKNSNVSEECDIRFIAVGNSSGSQSVSIEIMDDLGDEKYAAEL